MQGAFFVPATPHCPIPTFRPVCPSHHAWTGAILLVYLLLYQ